MKSYDIFRSDVSGPVWLESRLYVDHARARIQELATRNPGTCFFVFDTETSSVIGERTFGNTPKGSNPENK
jgi:hypothetical protein